MVAFETKPLTQSKRVCFRLKEAREAQGISLPDLEKRTKISARHLLALEECRFEDIPYGTIYQKHFLKAYTQALALPVATMLEQFEHEETIHKQESQARPALSRKDRWRMSNIPQLLRLFGSGLLIILFAFYLGSQIKSIIDPPRLTLFTPDDGYVTTGSTLSVRGQSDNAVVVSINDQEVKTDTVGAFAETIHLSTGMNTIVVKAKKKHGKEISMTRHVIVRDQPQFSYSK